MAPTLVGCQGIDWPGHPLREPRAPNPFFDKKRSACQRLCVTLRHFPMTLQIPLQSSSNVQMRRRKSSTPSSIRPRAPSPSRSSDFCFTPSTRWYILVMIPPWTLPSETSFYPTPGDAWAGYFVASKLL